MEKFIASVEKYKQLENDKQENKHEYDKLINQKKDNLDAIITGIPSEEFQQNNNNSKKNYKMLIKGQLMIKKRL